MQQICYLWSPQHVAENADSAPLLMWVEAACIKLQQWMWGSWWGHSSSLLDNDAFDKPAARQLFPATAAPTKLDNEIFFHAVSTRGLFAQETKMPSRPFKSINETVSLVFIFTTWLALSSLITTPKGLFAAKTSPRCSGNYHWNLFYSVSSVWLPMVWEHWNTYKVERLLKSKSDFNKGMSCFI